ncbi:MAG: rhodanese family protein [Phycisphaerae bacterium]|nr:rhodanese family protein [Phycisphaerae bacterium]
MVAAGSSTEVDPRTVQQWLDAGEAVLVDVREADEHRHERIAGAVLVPLSKFRPEAIAHLPGQRIVIHCKSGRRGADACRMAADLGALNLAGGIEAWKREGLPVVRGGGVGISVLRQVQMVVGVMVLASVALGYLVHPGFLGIAAFFGAGLTFAGATGFCGLAAVLSAMPWNKAPTAERAKSGKGSSCCGGSCH